ncbi:hypothetical protein DFH09DRAFT_1090330 [Mycena vulgaris]|nr:hypothetical protein DFH09DRAFT_1090330 [Mycena vulgaris]
MCDVRGMYEGAYGGGERAAGPGYGAREQQRSGNGGGDEATGVGWRQEGAGGWAGGTGVRLERAGYGSRERGTARGSGGYREAGGGGNEAGWRRERGRHGEARAGRIWGRGKAGGVVERVGGRGERGDAETRRTKRGCSGVGTGTVEEGEAGMDGGKRKRYEAGDAGRTRGGYGTEWDGVRVRAKVGIGGAMVMEDVGLRRRGKKKEEEEGRQSGKVVAMNVARSVVDRLSMEKSARSRQTERPAGAKHATTKLTVTLPPSGIISANFPRMEALFDLSRGRVNEIPTDGRSRLGQNLRKAGLRYFRNSGRHPTIWGALVLRNKMVFGLQKESRRDKQIFG